MSILTLNRIAALALIPSLALGEEGSSQLNLNPSGLSSLLQMIAGLLVILAVIASLAWLMRRYTGLRGTAGAIKIIGGLAVGTRERMVLVEVEGVRLLVGIAPGRLQTLHVFKAPDASESSASFSALLSQQQGKCHEQLSEML